MSELLWFGVQLLALATTGAIGYWWGHKDGHEAGRILGFKRGIQRVTK